MTPSIASTSGIYRITCTSTSKFYIGSALNLRSRWNMHTSELNRNKHKNPKLQRAWLKYGASSFIFEILEFVLIPEMLTAREQYWFKKLQPFGTKGFNIAATAGSNLGKKASPETLEKLRGRSPSPEVREKLRQGNLGKKMSPEAIRKSVEKRRGKKASLASREKSSISHLGNTSALGHIVSAEARVEMGKGRRGKPSPNLGKKASPETIERLRISHIGKVQSEETRQKRMKTLILIAPDGTEHVVTGIGRFCLDHNLHSSALLLVAKGKASHHKGWRARFPD